MISHRFSIRDRLTRSATAIVALAVTLAVPTFVYPQQAAPATRPAASQSTTVRELFVPADQLDKLLNAQTRRIYMSRDEYAKLLAEAVKQSPEEPPHSAAIVEASHQIDLEDGRAAIVSTLTIDALRGGQVAVALPLRGAGVRSAQLQHATRPRGDPSPQAAPLARTNTGAMLFLPHEGRFILQLELTCPVETEAAQQTVALELPRGGSTRIAMSAPGNVEVKSGVEVLGRRVDGGANKTHFELGSWSGLRRITLSLNNRRLREERALVCRSVIVDEVTEAYERLHITSSFDALHGAVESLRFSAPLDWDISDVRSELLAKWSVTEEADGQIIEVQLSRPVRGQVSCNILASRSAAEVGPWEMPQFKPLDTAGNVAVVGLLLEQRLKPMTVAAEQVLAIDSQLLADALPESVLRFEPGQPQVRPVFAFYAPRGEYQVQGQLAKPPAALSVVANLLLTASEERLGARGALVVRPGVERRFDLEFTSPAGWRLESLQTEQGAQIVFERIGEEAERTIWRARLLGPLEPETPFVLLLDAEAIDVDWLGAWDATTIAAPRFELLDADSQVGSIAVQLAGDLAVQPENVTGLSPLDTRQALERLGDATAALAYSFDGDYSAEFRFQRLKPYISGRSYAFLHLEPNRLGTHLELHYTVQQARVKQLRFSLPVSTPQVISIRGLNGVGVRDVYSEEVGDQRVWTAELDAPRTGSLLLAVDFERTWRGEPEESLVPEMAILLDVAYQTSVVAVEGDSQLDVSIDTTARAVDVGELAAANYAPGKRLMGAFEFVGEAGEFTVAMARRKGHALPAALIEKSEIVTVLEKNGRCQSVARMQLNSKAAFLEVRMPDGAELWSVLVDGIPVTPQRSGEQLLLSLASAETTRRSIQIVYETKNEPFNALGQFEVEGPQLYVRANSGSNGNPIPVADLKWSVLPPRGYRLIQPQGAVFQTTRPRSTSMRWVKEFSRTIRRSDLGLAASLTSPSAEMAQTAESLDREFAEFEEAPKFSDDAATKLALGLDRPGADPKEPQDSPTTISAPEAPSAMPSTPRSRKPDAKPEADAEVATPEKSMPGGGGLGGGRTVPATGRPGDGRSAQPENGAAQDAREDASGRYTKLWALAGLRSLPIDLQQSIAQADSDDLIEFTGLGAEPRLAAELVSQQRLDTIAWAWGLLILAIGVAMTRAPAAAKVRLILLTGFISILTPLVVDESQLLGPMGFCGFLAAVTLIPYYLATALIGWLYRSGRRWTNGAGTATSAMVVVLVSLAPAIAQEPHLDWTRIFDRLAHPTPVRIPGNAVVIPYTLSEAGKLAEAIDAAEKVLVPYDTYVRLWNIANPDQRIAGPSESTPFAFAGAEYRLRLIEGDQLLIEGRLTVEVYSDEPVLAPLGISGGVLSRAIVDGAPARLHTMVPPAAQQEMQQQQAANAPAASQPVLALLLEGRGRKKVELTIRTRLERQGGWRIVAARLPGDMQTSLEVLVPKARTEVRLTGVFDRELFETNADNETIATSLDSRSEFRLQWRPKVTETQIDRTLTAESTAVWDVQDEGLRLLWDIQLKFRQSRRDSFSFLVPEDYLVEQVEGDNVRSWRVAKEADRQRIEVTLLKAVTGQARFSLRLTKREAVNAAEQTVPAPIVEAAGAALHSGRIFVRRSPMLDVSVVAQRGVSQTDLETGVIDRIVQQAGSEASPLGIRNFQAFRFASANFDLQVGTKPLTIADAEISTRWQTVLQISADTARLETLVQISSPDQTLQTLTIRTPNNFDVERVEAESLFDWSIEDADGVRRLHLFFTAGQIGQFAVVIAGEFPGQTADQAMPIPQLTLENAKRREGQIVINADPGLQVQPRNLVGLQSHPVRGFDSPALTRVQAWLSDENRQLAQWVLDFKDAEYSGELGTLRQEPNVSVTTVTNIRVSDQTIEETILLRFQIRNAGARELRFVLPAQLREARIQAPSLRRKTVADQDPNFVEVRLEFQEALLGEVIVVVEHDRLNQGVTQSASIPAVSGEIAETFQQYVALENASRDEIVITRQEGLEPLGRRTAPPELRGINLNRAFAVRENAVLEYDSKSRDVVTTVEARIELSETQLVMDEAGVYRVEQIYHVDNRTEQFLEVELPVGSRLWTVIVANQPVKTAASPAGGSFVRIPLVKTAIGDPNYTIRIQYGGRIARLGGWSSVQFPLMQTVNINVEQSLVRLYLPDSHRWGRFVGTARNVVDESALARGYAKYLSQQISKTKQALESKNAYRRARARNNLRQLGLAMQDFSKSQHWGDAVQQDLASNESALREIQEQIQIESDESDAQTDNRKALNEWFFRQSNSITTNQSATLGDNFGSAAINDFNYRKEGQEKTFDKAWLARNKLSLDDAQKDPKRSGQAVDSRVVTRDAKQRPAKANEQEALAKGKEVFNRSFAQSAGRQQQMQQGQTARSNLELAQEYGRKLEAQSGEQRFGLDSERLPQIAMNQSIQLFDADTAEIQDGEETRLASLDIALPVRGVAYQFTTPRGDVRITGQAVSQSMLQRLVAILLIVLLLVAWLVGQRIARQLWTRVTGASQERQTGSQAS